MSRVTLTLLTCLAVGKMEFPDLDSTKYSESVQKLCDEFTSIMPEFRQDENKAKLSAHPFDLAVEDSPDDCQMELIDLQAYIDTRGDIQKILWWTFTNSMFVESFPIYNLQNLSRHARKMISLFGSTTAVSNSFKK